MNRYFFSPSAAFYDSSTGDPDAGGALYFYENNTTTKKAIYSDYARTTAADNPVLLDADGRCEVVLGAGGYTVRYENKDGVEVWTKDDVYSEQSATDNTFSPGMFGGVGDGSTNDYQALQDCIDEAQNEDGSVFLPPGKIWKYDTPLNNIGGLLIYGGGMDGLTPRSVLRPDGCHGFHITGQTDALAGRFQLRDFAIDGQSTAGTNHGFFYDSTNTFHMFSTQLQNIRILNMGGIGFYSQKEFDTQLINCVVTNCVGNQIEMSGGNTVTLMNVYVGTLATDDTIGFRLHGGGTLISCNGLDSANGIWAEFGDTVAEDGSNRGATAILIGCNIEDFGDVGIRHKYAGMVHCAGRCTFVAQATGTYDYFYESEDGAGNALSTGGDTFVCSAGTSFTSKGATANNSADIKANNVSNYSAAAINFTPDGSTVITPAKINSKRDGSKQRIYIPDLEVDDLQAPGVPQGGSNNNQSFTPDADNIGAYSLYSNNTAYTITLPGTGDTAFPVGNFMNITNINTTAAVSIASTTGVTLWYLTGSERYPLTYTGSGGPDLGPGVRATLFRYSTSAWWLWHNGAAGPKLNPVTTVSTTPYNVDPQDVVLMVDTTTLAITINLEDITASQTGRHLIVIDQAGNAGTNNITITPNTGDQVRGAANLVISSNYGKETLSCDGQTNGQWI